LRVHFAVLALLLSPSIAAAELPTFIPSAVAPEPDRPFVFAAPHLGLNAPLGLLGGELGVGYDWFRASVGAGIALGGTQVAATIRAMPRMSSVDVGVGLGVSRGGALHEIDIAFGESSSDDDPPGTVQYDSNTLWLNLELVLELPLPGGAFTRFYGGITSPLYVECVHEPDIGPDEPCDEYQRDELREERYQPFVGFATGFRWPRPPRARGVWIPAQSFAVPPPPFGY
jgi:8-oxo-dGTP pyrophosphatase MutT (NUDIX family)